MILKVIAYLLDEILSEINKNKLEVYEITRINLKCHIEQKSIYCMIPFIKFINKWNYS